MRIRLRRDSDNAEKDFESNDSPAIVEWVGEAAAAYVVYWDNFKFPTLTRQPRFVMETLGLTPLAAVANPRTNERALIFPELDNSKYNGWLALQYADQSGNDNNLSVANAG